MQIWLALRAFWAVLLNRAIAEQVRRILPGDTSPQGEAQPDRVPSDAEKSASTRAGETKAAAGTETKAALSARPAPRSEAITLLATLQREARLLDLVQEPLGNYSDAQIGAAARDVLRSSAAVLERLFTLRPATDQEEGSDVDVPRGYDPLQYKLAGNVSGEPPFRGKLAHHGWIATRCELPAWTGSARAANIVAPIEVELG